ncbi:MAG: Trk system potassium transporter TrkA [Thermodesulfobacteriota bacterium]|nr:Trk system potassium transporter TrkA [Thermodesulfobacteriota bacterium]
MKIAIIGAGEVGFYLAQRLSLEKHDLVIIDNDPEKCAHAQEALDVSVIEGSASSQSVLKDAGLESADMLIAASGVDEINLIACMIASKMGVRRKIARVRNPDYYEKSSILKPEDLGVDLFIHPEEEVIEEITRLLMRASASEVIEFENGKVLVVGLKLDGQCPNLNKPLKEIGREEERRNIRVVAMLKGEKTIIPTGEDYFSKNDQIFVVAKREGLPHVLSLTGKTDQKLDKIMILGGGKIGRGLAAKLEEQIEVTLIESNKEKSVRIASQLRRTAVYQADGTEIDTLAREGLLNMDAFIAVTGDDENNILSCLLAKHLGIHKTIALVNKPTYLPLLPVIGIDSTVNVRLSTASAILRFIRRGAILSAATFHGIDAEAIEFEVMKSNKVTGKPIKDLGLPKGSLIAAVVRKEEVFIPHGRSSLELGDKVIVIALPKAISAIEKRFS